MTNKLKKFSPEDEEQQTSPFGGSIYLRGRVRQGGRQTPTVVGARKARKQELEIPVSRTVADLTTSAVAQELGVEWGLELSTPMSGICVSQLLGQMHTPIQPLKKITHSLQ